MTDKYHDDPNDFRRVYHYRRPVNDYRGAKYLYGTTTSTSET